MFVFASAVPEAAEQLSSHSFVSASVYLLFEISCEPYWCLRPLLGKKREVICLYFDHIVNCYPFRGLVPPAFVCKDLGLRTYATLFITKSKKRMCTDSLWVYFVGPLLVFWSFVDIVWDIFDTFLRVGCQNVVLKFFQILDVCFCLCGLRGRGTIVQSRFCVCFCVPTLWNSMRTVLMSATSVREKPWSNVFVFWSYC